MLAQRRIILASNSPRRIELLQKMGVLFSVQPSGFDESLVLRSDPKEYVRLCALGKAMDVALGLQDGIVLGADTIVVLGKKIFGKPKNDAEARKTLSRLSGKTHSVLSGIALVNAKTKGHMSCVEETKIKFKKLSRQMIEDYILGGECFGKSGSYAVQGRGAEFVEGYEGSYSNIVGLPVERLKQMLGKMQA